MNQRYGSLEAGDRKALRDYIRDSMGSLRSGSDVEDIIRLAIASASSISLTASRKPEVALVGSAVHTTTAFEQRIVALFGD